MERKKTKRPEPFRDMLHELVQAARIERGSNGRRGRVGYVKLANLVQCLNEDTISKALRGDRRGKLRVDDLIRLLDALGYHLIVAIRERELSYDERAYFNECGRGKQAPKTTAHLRHAFTIHGMVAGRRLGKRKNATQKPTRQRARQQRSTTMETQTNVLHHSADT